MLAKTEISIGEYKRYSQQVLKIIGDINTNYGTDEWRPLHALLGNDRTHALAALQFYDVLLVNPIIDGMNLVAKEGPVVNQRDGVLVLSQTAGAFEQLAEASIPISPTDVAETAQALYTRGCRATDVPLSHCTTRRFEVSVAVVPHSSVSASRSPHHFFVHRRP